MTTLHRRTTQILAVTAVLAMFTAACSSSSKSSTSTSSSSSSASGSSSSSSSSGGTTSNKASAPGITATTITIGSHQPLTGVAAPGYDEIAPASQAYFQWVNAHGGIYGRMIDYKFLDDGYNPANTVTVVHQLVEQDNVFAIFNGLGTPTHEAVEQYLNTNKIPDLFVASGCDCWNNVSQDPYTFGWQPDYTIEGEIDGQYVKQNYAGMKIGYMVQNDDFGQGGVKGLDMQIPASQVVSRQNYDPTNINVGPQISALQAAGVQVVVSYSVPAFTALELLAAAKIGFHPTWVVSNVGSDPITLTGLLSSFSKGAAGGSLINGIVTDDYVPPVGETSNPWNQLFKQIHDQYIPKLPLDGNVTYGMEAAYTFAQAMVAAGQNPTRDDVVHAIENSHFAGPGLVPFGFTSSDHQGYLGVQMGTINNGVETLIGMPYTATDSGNVQPYTTAPAAPPANGIPTAG